MPKWMQHQVLSEIHDFVFSVDSLWFFVDKAKKSIYGPLDSREEAEVFGERFIGKGMQYDR